MARIKLKGRQKVKPSTDVKPQTTEIKAEEANAKLAVLDNTPKVNAVTEEQHNADNAKMIADMQAQSGVTSASNDGASADVNKVMADASTKVETGALNPYGAKADGAEQGKEEGITRTERPTNFRVSAPDGYWQKQREQYNAQRAQKPARTIESMMDDWQAEDDRLRKERDEKEKVHSALDNVMRGFESVLGSYQVQGGGTHINSGEQTRKADEKDRFNRYRQMRQEKLQDYTRKLDVEKMKQNNAIKERQLAYNERRQDYLEGKAKNDDEWRRFKFGKDDEYRNDKLDYEKGMGERKQDEVERSHKANEGIRRSAVAVSAARVAASANGRSGSGKTPQTFYGEYVLPAGTNEGTVNRIKKDIISEFGIEPSKEVAETEKIGTYEFTKKKQVNKTATEIEAEISAIVRSGKADHIMNKYGITKRQVAQSESAPAPEQGNSSSSSASQSGASSSGSSSATGGKGSPFAPKGGAGKAESNPSKAQTSKGASTTKASTTEKKDVGTKTTKADRGTASTTSASSSANTGKGNPFKKNEKKGDSNSQKSQRRKNPFGKNN